MFASHCISVGNQIKIKQQRLPVLSGASKISCMQVGNKLAGLVTKAGMRAGQRATGSNTENRNNAAGNVEIELDKNGDVVMEVEYAEPVVPGANFKDPAKWQRVGRGGKIASGEKHPRSYASAAKVSKKSAPVAPVLSKNATFAEKKAFKKSKETKEKAALSYAEQAKLIAEQRVRSESIKAGETIPETQQPPRERITYSSFVWPPLFSNHRV